MDKLKTVDEIMSRFLGSGVRPVTVHRESDPYDAPTTPDYNYNAEPSLTGVIEAKQEKPIASNEHMRWLDMIRDREPARKDELTTHQLLARIADLLSQQRQVDTPSDFMRIISYNVPANIEREYILRDISQFGYFYVPPPAVDTLVYYGIGRGQFLGRVPTDLPGNFVIPRVDALTIVTPSNPTPYTVTIYPSTRPISFIIGVA